MNVHPADLRHLALTLLILPAVANAETLLRYDFNETVNWPLTSGMVAGPFGTIDVAGGKDPSGIRLAADKGTATIHSGLLAVKDSETNLAKVTLAFNLSVAVARPVTVRVVSFNAERKRGGGLEKIIYPAARDYHQRFAVDLDTMKAADGDGFNPADPFVSFTFEVKDADPSQELRLDNRRIFRFSSRPLTLRIHASFPGCTHGLRYSRFTRFAASGFPMISSFTPSHSTTERVS
jgi:hypothetical protein